MQEIAATIFYQQTKYNYGVSMITLIFDVKSLSNSGLEPGW